MIQNLEGDIQAIRPARKLPQALLYNFVGLTLFPNRRRLDRQGDGRGG
jgi:hypothetical protein